MEYADWVDLLYRIRTGHPLSNLLYSLSSRLQDCPVGGRQCRDFPVPAVAVLERGAFVNDFNAILIGLIALAVSVFVADKIIGERGPGTPNPAETQAIAERIRPLGQVNVAVPAPVAAIPTATPVLVSSAPPPSLLAASVPPPTGQKVEPTPTNTPGMITSGTSDAPANPPPPVAAVEPTQPEVSAPPIDLAASKKIYVNACFACHETGAAGAPKRGDQAAWHSRITQGMDTLLAHAMNGINAMPPRGGNPTLTEEQIVTAIHYLVLDIETNQ
ncbi:hypothetical protein CCP3SC1_130028 [Gammaproteobacteria bacterium]